MLAAAVVWHVVLFGACVALGAGWRPSQRRAGALLAAPVASVSAAAFGHGNPFNGVVFAALALVMLGLAIRIEPRPVQRSGTVPTIIAIALIAFGWLYPHFLASRSPVIYLVAAPTGLIPCPTLSLVVGFTLLAGGFGSRAWSMVVGAVGILYGVFGVVRLGVGLDAALAAGALCAFVLALEAPSPSTG
jgi:hypothetical protein